MDKTYIYGLVSKKDPNSIRYIGKADDPYHRLKRHIHNTKYDKNKNKKLTHKDRWIIKEDYQIDLVILEICNKTDWYQKEKEHISKYNNLTNTSEGGMGGSGVKYTKTYGEVKEWVKNNTNLKSKSDWYNHIKFLPDDIPSNPREVFLKKGWVSWGDFLSTGRVWDNLVDYLTYDEAKKIIKKYQIKTGEEYKNLAKRGIIPDNIPNRPERFYKKRGWISWGDYLGTGRIANQYKKKTH